MKTCILGLGKSGVASAGHALAEGDEVVVYAGRDSEAARKTGAELELAGAKVVYGVEEVEGRYDRCIASPGIPQTGSFYQSALAASDELMSEPEYAWRLSPGGWVGITGTNGKTTTTSLVTFVLNSCGMPAAACGNIGDTTIAAVEARAEGQMLVAELSSYQIASTSRLSCDVAVLLNITPDHLSWHGSFHEYAQAKFRLLDQLAPRASAIVGVEIDGFADISRRLEQRGVRCVALGAASDGDCAYLSETEELVVSFRGRQHVLCKAEELQIKGAHNVQNALAAAATCIALGAEPAGVARALVAFEPLEHRIEPCGSVAGVEFFNDSKATNVDATLKALTAFPGRPIVLMLGGRDKNTELEELVAACEGTCAAVICYGEAGPRFAQAFAASAVPCRSAEGMEEAFSIAFELAAPGQAVVLSPACASFDEFHSFEQRGDVFKAYVRRLAAERG